MTHRFAAAISRDCEDAVHSMSHSRFGLGGHSFGEVFRLTWTEIQDDDIFGRAAQLAYYFFLGLFPFLIFVVASLSVFGFADRGRALLFQVGSSALPGIAFEVINDAFNDILRASGPLKMSFGVIGSVWAASAGISAIMDTLNAAYAVKETRSVIKRYAIAVALVAGIGLLLVVSMVLILMGDTIVGTLRASEFVSLTLKIVKWPLALGLSLLAFAITYYFAPDLREKKWHWITPGAVAGLILWVIASVGLRLYSHFFNSFSYTYGSLAGVIVLLLWFYLSGIALLSGGAINSVLERLQSRASQSKTVTGFLPGSSQISTANISQR